LIICEVVHISIDENVFTDGKLDPHKLDLMGRLGRNYYVRASGDALMEIYQSVTDKPIGFDGLPEHIIKSPVLTGNEIAALASLLTFPDRSAQEKVYKNLFRNEIPTREILHTKASELIRNNQLEDALAILMF